MNYRAGINIFFVFLQLMNIKKYITNLNGRTY